MSERCGDDHEQDRHQHGMQDPGAQEHGARQRDWLIRLRMPKSRWNVMVSAMLLKQTVITASAAIPGT